jgi:DNA polymerase-1
MRHRTQAEDNMDPETVLRYLSHTLGNSAVPKVGANAIYDVGWLLHEGVDVRGPVYDIQFAEALLDSETPNVALDILAHKYLNVGKTTNALYEWLHEWTGHALNDRIRKWLYMSPPQLAGPYAEDDASLPIKILTAQWPRMVARGVLELFDIECRLIPLLVRMRMQGVPIEVGRAEQVYEEFGTRIVELQQRLRDLTGREVNPAARDSMQAAFDAVGLATPTKTDTKTRETKVSFDKGSLAAIDHPLPALILEHRKLEKVRGTFIKSYLLDKHINGRVYCSFHPLRNDSNGARSGRFASSDPNLQNIPVRTEEGRRVREAFVARGLWRSIDYSQIEYRMLAHHAVGDGADALRAQYHADPTTDYHVATQHLVKRRTGLTIDRKPIKNINFGLMYGMSEPKLAMDLGLDAAGAKQLFNAYHDAAPYVKATMDACSAEVHMDGYVETILGRKSDFNRWTYSGRGDRRNFSFEQACDEWGMSNIERAMAHKALNRKLQGGAADVMKRSMVAAYEAGLFAEDACGMPLLTVHDELDFDDLGDPHRPAWQELQHVMQTAMPQMRVPVIADVEVGVSWGEVMSPEKFFV